MRSSGSSLATDTQRSFTIVRSFDAPRRLVFRTWVEPDLLMKWWAPPGMTLLSCDLDLKIGGRWHMRLRLDDSGTILSEGGTYREIDEPRRLTFTHAWERTDGSQGHQTVIDVGFTETARRTTVTFSQMLFASERSCALHEAGWSGSFELLAAHFGKS